MKKAADFVIETRLQHGGLHHALHQAEASLQSVAPRQEFVRALCSLRRDLLSHFQHEEQGGYFAEAIERAPRIADKAMALSKQHERLLQLIEQVETQANAEQSSGLEGAFGVFKQELLSHEIAEDELLQEAYWDDIGDKD